MQRSSSAVSPTFLAQGELTEGKLNNVTKQEGTTTRGVRSIRQGTHPAVFGAAICTRRENVFPDLLHILTSSCCMDGAATY